MPSLPFLSLSIPHFLYIHQLLNLNVTDSHKCSLVTERSSIVALLTVRLCLEQTASIVRLHDTVNVHRDRSVSTNQAPHLTVHALIYLWLTVKRVYRVGLWHTSASSCETDSYISPQEHNTHCYITCSNICMYERKLLSTCLSHIWPQISGLCHLSNHLLYPVAKGLLTDLTYSDSLK